MLYKKTSVELIVIANGADAVIGELNEALDLLEKQHTVFGGESRQSLSSTRGFGEDRHWHIQWPRVNRSPLLSGQRVRTLRPRSALSSDVSRFGPPRPQSTHQTRSSWLRSRADVGLCARGSNLSAWWRIHFSLCP